MSATVAAPAAVRVGTGVWPRLLRDKVAAVALAVVLLLVAAALLAPALAPSDPADNDLAAMMAPPGGAYLLGADDQGRSMVTRLLYGLRLTLLTGASAVALGGSAGALLGLLAAFYRRLDQPVMRCMDVLLSFPAILFGLAIAGIMPVATRAGMARMAELALGARIPARLLRAVSRAADDEAVASVGVHWATEQCRDLLDNGVDGIHFYTLNRSDATRRIYENLGVRDSAALRGEAAPHRAR